jgi:hypothetical protein
MYLERAVKSALARLVHGRDVGTVLDKKADERQSLLRGAQGRVERCATGLICKIDAEPVFEEKRHECLVLVAGGQMQRRCRLLHISNTCMQGRH